MRRARHCAHLLASIAPLLACATAPLHAQGTSAEPFAVLDLPFKVTAMRGPGSEVALGVATSGLLPIAKTPAVAARPATADPKAAPAVAPTPQDEAEAAPVAVVWGEGGGAVLDLGKGGVRATLIGAEAIEGLVAAETPRDAVPGSRRALSGPLSAYLSGPTRGTDGAGGQAAGLTIRERQPIGVTGEPKPVPIRTATLSPGHDAVFAARPPRIIAFDGRPAVLAVTQGAQQGTQRDARQDQATSALVLAGKDASGTWGILARTAPQAGRRARDQADGRPSGPGESDAGAPMAPVGIADFSGTGRPQIAALREPDGAGVLQLWSYADGALTLTAEAPGFAGPADANGDGAAVIPPEPGAAPDLVLPAADRSTLVVVSAKGGVIAERARLLLPAPVGVGLTALGRGARAHLLVGLKDGRVAVVPTSVPAEVRP